MTRHPAPVVDVVAAYLAGWVGAKHWPNYRPVAVDLLDTIECTRNTLPAVRGANLRHPHPAEAKILTPTRQRAAEANEEPSHA